LSQEFYKSTEASDVLGVSLRTFYRYIEEGLIQVLRVDPKNKGGLKRILVTKEELVKFIEGGEYNGRIKSKKI